MNNTIKNARKNRIVLSSQEIEELSMQLGRIDSMALKWQWLRGYRHAIKEVLQ